jgi:hypothetical protein
LSNGRAACRYRGDEGCKCAIGHLIPDDKYDPAMETLRVASLIQKFPAIREDMGDPETDGDINFLQQCQFMHDDVRANWSVRFEDLVKLTAQQFKLAVPEGVQ